jgi:hypothetical protein
MEGGAAMGAVILGANPDATDGRQFRMLSIRVKIVGLR